MIRLHILFLSCKLRVDITNKHWMYLSTSNNIRVKYTECKKWEQYEYIPEESMSSMTFNCWLNYQNWQVIHAIITL